MTSQYYNTISLFELLLGFEDAEEKLFYGCNPDWYALY